MNSLLIALVVCLNDGSQCSSFEIVASEAVYESVCVNEPEDKDWVMLNNYVSYVAPEELTKGFMIDSIDCMGK